jgi:hypothetical protein
LRIAIPKGFKTLPAQNILPQLVDDILFISEHSKNQTTNLLIFLAKKY